MIGRECNECHAENRTVEVNFNEAHGSKKTYLRPVFAVDDWGRRPLESSHCSIYLCVDKTMIGKIVRFIVGYVFSNAAAESIG